MPQFKIEQIALYPASTRQARSLLEALGLTEWVTDTVVASGEVFGVSADCEADLQFNYQAAPEGKLELEVLEYNDGTNWMDVSINQGTAAHTGSVSHLGMHVTEEQLDEFAAIMAEHGIEIAQNVVTNSHTNPAIKDTRRYMYVIYETRRIIGVDLKFIVRLPIGG